MKLGDVFKITSGGTPDTKNPLYYEGGNIPWIKTGDLKEKYISESVECITEDGLNNSSAKIFPAGTVLVAMYGATIGACSILPFEAATNQACAAFIPNDNILPNYLYYFLCSKKNHFIQDGVGGAQPNISAGYLKNVEFLYPSLPEQNHIAAILDKTSDIISLRKQQVTKLDELVKSRFVEMFGDPMHTDIFPKKSGSILFAFSSGKFLEKEKRQQEGIPVYGGNGIAWYTSQAMIDYPTIILGRVGAYCGNVKIVKEPVWITDNAIYIKKFKTDDYNIDFLYFLMGYLEFSQFAEVSGQPKITQKPLETAEYIVPPITLQNQFAAFVEQTEKTKAAIKQSLNRLETLKKALMQEFFG